MRQQRPPPLRPNADSYFRRTPFDTPGWRELERLCRDPKSRTAENIVGARLRELWTQVGRFPLRRKLQDKSSADLTASIGCNRIWNLDEHIRRCQKPRPLFLFDLRRGLCSATKPPRSPSSTRTSEARAAAVSLCESEGYRVLPFASADDFLRAGPPGHVTCIVLDISMPDRAGIEVLRRLAERGSAPPVIVLTGRADIGLVVEAMKLRAIDLIEKPYRPETLLEALGRARISSDGSRLGLADEAGGGRARRAPDQTPAGGASRHRPRRTEQDHRLEARPQRAHRRILSGAGHGEASRPQRRRRGPDRDRRRHRRLRALRPEGPLARACRAPGTASLVNAVSTFIP